MVLAVDIGNSNICIGGLAGEAHRDILFTTRMVTRPRCTADEYAELRFLLGRLKVDPTACEGVIVCSVVPGLTPVLAHACRRLTGRNALIVSNALDTGLTFAVDEPDRVGRDRLADAAAAASHYPLPCMTVDMGTATTMTVIDREARVLGGAIIPGVGISLEALANGTSQLPHISLDAPKKCISTDTVEAMRSGSVYGTAAMLDGMIERMEAELGEPAAVIATGGLGGCIIPHCRREITYDKNLLLNGLWALYQKNKRKR